MVKAVGISRFEADQSLLAWTRMLGKGVFWVILRIGRRFPQATAIPPLTSRADALNVVDRVRQALSTRSLSHVCPPASNDS
jgi:hypothetical protein